MIVGDGLVGTTAVGKCRAEAIMKEPVLRISGVEVGERARYLHRVGLIGQPRNSPLL